MSKQYDSQFPAALHHSASGKDADMPLKKLDVAGPSGCIGQFCEIAAACNRRLLMYKPQDD